MRSSHTLDRIAIRFDERGLIADAGLILPATLAEHLGLRALFDRHVDLGDAAGRASVGDKALTLIMSALAGGDCIDDADALRAGGMGAVLGHDVPAPSTLGTFLRSFSWAQHPQQPLGARLKRTATVRSARFSPVFVLSIVSGRGVHRFHRFVVGEADRPLLMCSRHDGSVMS
jgi:hypothetical protein